MDMGRRARGGTVTPLESIAFALETRDPGLIFGKDPDEARSNYKRMLKQCHPDRFHTPEDIEAALRVSKALGEAWGAWEARHAPVSTFTLETKLHAYVVSECFATGDIANLYGGLYQNPDGTLVKVAVKMPRSPKDSDLMGAEAKALKTLAAHPKFIDHQMLFPKLIESIRHRDTKTRTERRVNIFERLPGDLVTLGQVKEAYPRGIPPKDVAWIFRRVLGALGLAHRAGIIHGAISPEHILVHPVDHVVVMVDWCYSVPLGETVKAMVPGWEKYYPEEIMAKKPAYPGMDLYMAAELFSWMIDRDTNPLARYSDRPFRAFAKGCKVGRNLDAWVVLDDFDELLERLWGPRKYHRLIM